MRKFILLIFGIIICLFLSQTISLACSCTAPPKNKTEKQLIELEQKRSKAIFAGEVVEIVVPKTPSGELEQFAEVRFKVQRMWKGLKTEEVKVSTANVCCICGYEFKVGESYLVYANGNENLSTDTCTRTKRLSDAGNDLKVLGKGKTLKNKTSLQKMGEI